MAIRIFSKRTSGPAKKQLKQSNKRASGSSSPTTSTKSSASSTPEEQRLEIQNKIKNSRFRKNSKTTDAPAPVITIGGGFRSSLTRSDLSSRLVVTDNNSNSSIGTNSTVSSKAPQDEWHSCDVRNYHHHSPLIVKSAPVSLRKRGGRHQEQQRLEQEQEQDDATALGMVMARSRRLPGTWYFSSNHVMINNERLKSSVAPLIRKRDLDEIAHAHAAVMAQQQWVHHSTQQQQQQRAVMYRRMGENVASGSSIRDMHREMMQRSRADKNNILDRRYTHMGMGTARGKDGRLYMCQIFRG